VGRGCAGVSRQSTAICCKTAAVPAHALNAWALAPTRASCPPVGRSTNFTCSAQLPDQQPAAAPPTHNRGRRSLARHSMAPIGAGAHALCLRSKPWQAVVCLAGAVTDNSSSVEVPASLHSGWGACRQ
jgi:hypothetical protein